MKKRLLIMGVAAILTMCGLTGCKTEAERELEDAIEAANDAQEAYERELREYNQLQQDIESYQRALDALEQY